MLARIVQINISPGGLPKTPILQARLHTLGIEGDGHSHPKVHGGPAQAVLIACREVVDELVSRGFPLFHGALGENLTVEGLDRRALRAGQRYRAGDSVILRLTRPRGPCKALDRYHPELRAAVFDPLVKRGDPNSPVWGMSGFYAAVEQGGEVRPGAPFMFIGQDV